MPIVRVELSQGRTHEQKSKYVEEVTKMTAEVLGCSIETIDVIFDEIPATNWAHAGKMYAQPK